MKMMMNKTNKKCKNKNKNKWLALIISNKFVLKKISHIQSNYTIIRNNWCFCQLI